MTWSEWVNSPYNTDGYIVYNNITIVKVSPGYNISASSNSNDPVLSPSDVIIDGHTYYSIYSGSIK